MKLAARLAPALLALALSAARLPAREFLALERVAARAEAATAERYPDADDVLLDDFTRVAYRPDGTSETWSDTAVKILTEKGRRDNRILSLRFNTAYGTNHFTRVEVVKPDGTAVAVDIAAQARVMVDPGQMGANIYNPNSKVLQLSVPGLEIGDILRHVSRRVVAKAVVPGTWSDYQVFEHTSPIERMTYQVVAPRDKPLAKIALKAEIPGTVAARRQDDAEAGTITYTWTVRDVPRMFDEPNMPARYTVVQRLLVGTMEEWEELSRWYWELCRPRLEAATPAMEAKARELVAGCATTAEKIRAVFAFVSQQIRYMGITTEEEAPGYEPHDVRITFENRYGVCRDKAALLAAMLRLAGVEAFPVIIMAGPKKDEEVPQPFFNHAVTAALDDDGAYVLMDPTDENTKDIFPAYLQNMSYIVARPEGDTLRTSPIVPAEENLLRIATAGALDAGGALSARSTLVFEGINDTVYRNYFSKIKPEERRRFFEGHLKHSMPTATLRSLEIRPAELRDTTVPLAVELEYAADHLLVEGASHQMFALPRLGGSLGYANFLIGQTGLDRRNYPLTTRMAAGIRETLDLALPERFGTLHIPGYQPIRCDRLDWQADVAAEGARLAATNTFLLNTVEFSPQEYLGLKRSLREIEYDLRKKVVVERIPAASGDDGADVRILGQTTHIVLDDARAWRETTRSKIEILTYAGKKDHAEIKLAYNPAWQRIELARATVTLPDGTVRTIGDEEINLMDAAWVASAPRYPAERILVANLPGVEVGSVLEYETVSTVEGRPFFSTVQLFNGHEPIDRKTVTLAAPDSLPLAVRNTGIAETRTAADGTITYTWSAEGQPAVRKEEALPPWWTFNPALFVSTGDWKGYAREVRSHLSTAAKGQPGAAALAKELVAGLRGDRHKATALRDWVARNIRPAGPGLAALPLSAITPADRTLADRYGNNPDRMVLLHAMLKAARLQPRFVLSGSLSLIPEAAEPLLAVPSRRIFDTVLVKLDLEGETVWFGDESHYAAPGASAHDRRAMLDLSDGSIGTLRVPPAMADRSRNAYELALSAEGEAILSQTATLHGNAFEGFHRLYAEMTPENRRRHYLEMVAGVSQSAEAATELETGYGDYPGRFGFTVAAGRYAVRDGAHLYFTVPGGLGGLLQYRASERSLPLAWNDHTDTQVEYAILLPDGFEPAILPPDFSWQAPGGAGTIEVAVEYSSLANAVRIVQTADLRPALIPAADFPALLEAGRRLAHPRMRAILLKRSTPGRAPVKGDRP